jgi:UDP:flavonoid glycosyltransferase YjiC (YdhE family)
LPTLQRAPFTHHSPFLNLYLYPEQIDYTDIRPMPDKWHRIDALIRTDGENFELPTYLKKREGKWIFLSMGSLGSADTSLMTRLVDILKRSPHKFIVSTGLSRRNIQLADNMWGQEMVPQMKVLPLVDLVITHGGNNTITETLYFGKPMIVMPLFMDQFDNAQRIAEKGFGVKLDAYECSDEQLLAAVEKVLADKQMAFKLQKISKEMMSSNNIMTAVKLVERLSKDLDHTVRQNASTVDTIKHYILTKICSVLYYCLFKFSFSKKLISIYCKVLNINTGNYNED